MRTPKKKPFSCSRKRSKFKITNWPEYNNILCNRGRIDFMIAEDLSDGWYEGNSGNKKRGGQRRYSDRAIFMCLQIRYLFGLKMRQSQGFINWIFMLSGLPATCPDYKLCCINSNCYRKVIISGNTDGFRHSNSHHFV